MRSGNFGELLGPRLHAEHHVVLAVRTLRNADATITEVRSDRPTLERSDPAASTSGLAATVARRRVIAAR